MSYENYFKLKIIGEAKTKVPFCPNCKTQNNGQFCSKCGSPSEEIEMNIPNSTIINELLDSSDDCSCLLDSDGNSNDSGSGYTIENDIKEFSKKYPTLVFQLDIDWDNGFGDDPSRYYFKNGVKKDAKAKVVYNDPEF